REETLIVFFDESNCTVNDDRAIRAQQFRRLRQKVWKVSARNINFGNDEARFFSSDLFPDLLRVIRQIRAKLIRVGPISLPVRRQIVIAVTLESLFAIGISKPQQLQ